MRKIAVVYQPGCANVFDVTDCPAAPDLCQADRRRIYQHAVEPCLHFVSGIEEALDMLGEGMELTTYHCGPGDASIQPWHADDITRAL